jgi:hypothetical protein
MAVIEPDDHAAIAAVDKIENPHEAILAVPAEARMLQTDPIQRQCRTNYHARRSSGQRVLTQIWWIVLHDTEGNTAQAAASWFQNPDCQGSSNIVVDNRQCFRVLDDEEIPWGAPGANYHGWHVEQAGFARWSRIIWKKGSRKLIQRAAYKSALRCHKYKIPVRFCNAAMLQKGMKGITTHAECTKAFGGDHTDPGGGYPIKLFMWYCKRYLKKLNKRKVQV